MNDKTVYILIPWDDLDDIRKYKSIEQCLEYAIEKYETRYSVISMTDSENIIPNGKVTRCIL